MVAANNNNNNNNNNNSNNDKNTKPDNKQADVRGTKKKQKKGNPKQHRHAVHFKTSGKQHQTTTPRHINSDDDDDDRFLELAYRQAIDADRKRNHFHFRKGLFLGIGTVAILAVLQQHGGWFFLFSSRDSYHPRARAYAHAHATVEALTDVPQVQRRKNEDRKSKEASSTGGESNSNDISADETARTSKRQDKDTDTADDDAKGEKTPGSTTASTETETTITTAILQRSWELIETYAHDPSSFTQGFEVYQVSTSKGNNRKDDDNSNGNGNINSNDNNDSCEALSSEGEMQDESSSCAFASSSSGEEERILITESTGMYGDSLIRTWDLASGTILREVKMDERIFGEGSTQYTDNDGRELLAVLTYKEESILVHDANTLELVKTIDPWPSPTTTKEGWGIAFDPLERIFVVTDGSNMLHFWDVDFRPIPSRPPIPVRIEKLVDEQNRILIPQKPANNKNKNTSAPGGTVVGMINELEWDPYTNTLLANKWFETIILRIDPVTGVVIKVYDVGRLRSPSQPQHRGEDVLNGIAIVPSTNGKEWLLTGKYWPSVFRIRIVD